jgi:hypothetical protein
MAHAEADGTLSHLSNELIASLNDFHDPSQEWRRLFSELLGTFFLVLVAAGGGMMGQAFPGTISRAAAVGAPGLMVMAIILFMGKVSGAAKGDLYTEIEHPVRPEAVCGPSPVADVWAAYVPSFTPDHRRRE